MKKGIRQDVSFFSIDFINLFMRDTDREAETQVEGEAGSMQGPGCGTRSGTPGSCCELKTKHSTAEPPRRP